MNINIKDLKILLSYAKIDVESGKRTLNKYVDNNDFGLQRYLDSLHHKIEILEPIIEKIESELNNMQIPIV